MQLLKNLAALAPTEQVGLMRPRSGWHCTAQTLNGWNINSMS